MHSTVYDLIEKILGLKKLNEEEIQEERDILMRSQYFHPIENFPQKIHQLLDAINRVKFYIHFANK